jgi:hypothetical protein
MKECLRMHGNKQWHAFVFYAECWLNSSSSS